MHLHGNRGILVLAATAALWALAGCANQFKSIHHQFDPGSGQSISIDANQRAIYTIVKEFGDEKKWRAICAEPSPDALSALSQSLGLDLGTLNKSLGLAFSGQEAAASIGLRTQTITILRDVMYRLCEGYASGALDDIGFERLHRRYQATVIGLLAIEQLTGAIVAQQASLDGQARANLGQSVAKVSVLVQEARARAVATQAAAAAAKTDADAAKKEAEAAEALYKKAVAESGVDSEAAKAAQSTFQAKASLADEKRQLAQKSAEQEIVQAGELASLEALRKEMDRASAFASARAVIAPARSASAPSDAAAAVVEIVTTVVNRDYSNETCLDAVLSRSLRTLITKPKEDAPYGLVPLEVALKYCVYAIEVQAIRTGPGDVAAKAAALAGARNTFNTNLTAALAPLVRAPLATPQTVAPGASAPGAEATPASAARAPVPGASAPIR